MPDNFRVLYVAKTKKEKVMMIQASEAMMTKDYSATKGGVASFLFSLAIHAAVFASIAWGLPIGKSVSQGDTTLRPIEVAIIMSQGINKSAPEKLTAKPKKELKSEMPKPKIKNAEVVLKQDKKKDETKEQESEPENSDMSGQQYSALQQSDAATSGTMAGKADYFSTLKAWLEKHKTYPRRARLSGTQGTVVINFSMSRDGKVLSRHIIESSGHTILDEAAIEAVQKSSPLPQPPAQLADSDLNITVPFGFYLR